MRITLEQAKRFLLLPGRCLEDGQMFVASSILLQDRGMTMHARGTSKPG